mmetsp:Transcript_6660/g.23974  ORF Transcript_6660/g.23974 Transcript_6660/m.23974 type:complete len:762 (-) Transcript_6660:13-2298(-)
MEQGPLLDVGIELDLRLLVQGLVNVLLLGIQARLMDLHSERRELDVLRPSLLRPPQLGVVQHPLQLDHSLFPLAKVTKARDGIQDRPVEVRVVEGPRVAAALARFLLWPESPVQRLAVAALLPAKVVRVGVKLQESQQRVELPDPVLQGGPRQAPLVLASQRVHRLCHTSGPCLDLVGLVQDDAVPVRSVQQGALHELLALVLELLLHLDLLEVSFPRLERGLLLHLGLGSPLRRGDHALLRGSRRVLLRQVHHELWVLLLLHLLRPFPLLLRRRRGFRGGPGPLLEHGDRCPVGLLHQLFVHVRNRGRHLPLVLLLDPQRLHGLLVRFLLLLLPLQQPFRLHGVRPAKVPLVHVQRPRQQHLAAVLALDLERVHHLTVLDLHYRVGGQHNVVGVKVLPGDLGPVPVVDEARQRPWLGEVLDLLCPLHEGARGHHDESRGAAPGLALHLGRLELGLELRQQQPPALLLLLLLGLGLLLGRQQHGDGLDSLSHSHLVRQDSALHFALLLIQHPAQALLLEGQEALGERRGRVALLKNADRDHGIHVLRAELPEGLGGVQSGDLVDDGLPVLGRQVLRAVDRLLHGLRSPRRGLHPHALRVRPARPPPEGRPHGALPALPLHRQADLGRGLVDLLAAHPASRPPGLCVLHPSQVRGHRLVLVQGDPVLRLLIDGEFKLLLLQRALLGLLNSLFFLLLRLDRDRDRDRLLHLDLLWVRLLVRGTRRRSLLGDSGLGPRRGSAPGHHLRSPPGARPPPLASSTTA